MAWQTNDLKVFISSQPSPAVFTSFSSDCAYVFSVDMTVSIPMYALCIYNCLHKNPTFSCSKLLNYISSVLDLPTPDTRYNFPKNIDQEMEKYFLIFRKPAFLLNNRMFVLVLFCFVFNP